MKKCNVADIYREYNTTIKPLIAQIEAYQERVPLPILNEIRATHDHIARFYFENVDEDFQDTQIEYARRHNMRIILDCLKILNALYKKEMLTLEKRTNISQINSGKFYVKYAELADTAEKFSNEAKLIEGRDKEKAIELFQNATVIYREIHNLILQNRTHIAWARIRFYERPFWAIVLTLLGVAIGKII